MHQALCAAYQAVSGAHKLEQIPVGNAFALARQDLNFHVDATFNFDDPAPGALPDQTDSLASGWHWATDNTSDGNAQFCIDPKHCSALGRYLGAACWFERFSSVAA